MQLDLAGVFVAGFLTFVTPCVLPLIPVYLAAMLGGNPDLGKAPRLALLVRAAAFSSGFVLVFTLLGLGAATVGDLLASHRVALQTAGGLLILLFGLKLLGVIQVPALDRVLRADDRRWAGKSTLVGAFAMGLVFAAGWSPCVGPVLGTVLTYTASATAEPLVGALYLSVYGLGLALPLLLTAALADVATGLLRRLRPWLGRLERLTGAALLVVAISLLFDFAPQLPAMQAGAAGLTPAAGVVAAQPAAPGPRMLELYREDCVICQEMKPVVQRVVETCAGRGVEFGLHDVNQTHNRRLIGEHRLVGVPTFVFLDAAGAEAARLVGRQTEAALMQALAALSGTECPGVGSLPDHEILPCLEGDGVFTEGGTCQSTNLSAPPAGNASTRSSG